MQVIGSMGKKNFNKPILKTKKKIMKKQLFFLLVLAFTFSIGTNVKSQDNSVRSDNEGTYQLPFNHKFVPSNVNTNSNGTGVPVDKAPFVRVPLNENSKVTVSRNGDVKSAPLNKEATRFVESNNNIPNLTSNVNAPELSSVRDASSVQQDDSRAIFTVITNNGFFTTSPITPSGSRKYQRILYIIRPQDLAAAGFGSTTISSIGWDYYAQNAGGSQTIATNHNVKVYMQLTPDSTVLSKSGVWATAITGMTKVKDGTMSIPAGLGPFTIDLPVGGPGTSAFNYTAGMGIFVAIESETVTNIAPCGTNPLGSATPYANVTAGTNKCLFYRDGTACPLYNDTQSVAMNLISSVRPQTRLGNSQIDAVIAGPIYSLGKAAVCGPCPDSNLIFVNVFHEVDRLDTIIVTTTIKNVAGGGTKYQYIDTAIVDSIAWLIGGYLYPKGSVVCKLDSITVSVRVKGSEDVTGNNMSGYLKKSTLNDWNQAQPNGVLDGGVGFTGATGDFVADFYTPCTIPIGAVDLSFNIISTSQPYNVLIYASDNDTLKPGAVLFTSPGQTTPATAGIHRITYKLPSAVMVGPGYYFVGIRQSATLNIGFGFQNESPIRFGTFFFASPSGSNVWFDFADQGADFLLDIAPRTIADLQMKVFTEGFYQGNGVMIGDTMSVVVKSATTKKTVDSVKAYVGSNGVGTFNFYLVNCDSSYYWNVRHRTSISTFSRLTQKFDVCNKSYNFTDAANKAFGSNQVQYPNDNNAITFTMYTGNPNQDACVDATDVSQIDNDAFNFVAGYVSTDVNGNGIVDVIDLSLADNNAFNFVCVAAP